MSAEDEVRQASEQYYAALTSLLNGDVGPLTQIWSHSSDVTAMNPYGGREVGWEQLRPVFEQVAQMCLGSQLLRGVSPERSEWAQHDTTGFGRSSSLSAPILKMFAERARKGLLVSVE